jgi:GNAT superfamily N-acetyltransferase
MREIAVRQVDISDTRNLRQAVLRPHETVADLADSDNLDSFALGAFDGEELLGVGLIAPDDAPGVWRVRGMATAPHARGEGVGTAVLDGLLVHAVAGGAVRVWCNARTPARTLYERAGMRVCSAEFELPDIGPHYVMEIAFDASAR